MPAALAGPGPPRGADPSRLRPASAWRRRGRILDRERRPPAADDRHELAGPADLDANGPGPGRAARRRACPCRSSAPPCSSGWRAWTTTSGWRSTTWPSTSRLGSRLGPAEPSTASRTGSLGRAAAARRRGARPARRCLAGPRAKRVLGLAAARRRLRWGWFASARRREPAARSSSSRRWAATCWPWARRLRPGPRSSTSSSSSPTSRSSPIARG